MKTNSKETKSNKINTTLIGIVAIIGILLISWIAISHNQNTIKSSSNADTVGQVSEVITANIEDRPLCKFIVSKSEAYDNTNLITGLQVDSNVDYLGQNILITDINDNGCTIKINDNTEYIAIGQIQKIGPLYVTVTNVLG